MRRVPHKASGGYTLLELMVASAILAIGLTAVMRGFTAGTLAMRTNERRAIAVTLAQQKLQEIQGSSVLVDGTEDGQVEEPWSNYRWLSEIRTLEDYPNLARVRVAILWNEGEREDLVWIETLVRHPPSEDESLGTE